MEIVRDATARAWGVASLFLKATERERENSTCFIVIITMTHHFDQNTTTLFLHAWHVHPVCPRTARRGGASTHIVVHAVNCLKTRDRACHVSYGPYHA